MHARLRRRNRAGMRAPARHRHFTPAVAATLSAPAQSTRSGRSLVGDYGTPSDDEIEHVAKRDARDGDYAPSDAALHSAHGAASDDDFDVPSEDPKPARKKRPRRVVATEASGSQADAPPWISEQAEHELSLGELSRKRLGASSAREAQMKAGQAAERRKWCALPSLMIHGPHQVFMRARPHGDVRRVGSGRESGAVAMRPTQCHRRTRRAQATPRGSEESPGSPLEARCGYSTAQQVDMRSPAPMPLCRVQLNGARCVLRSASAPPSVRAGAPALLHRRGVCVQGRQFHVHLSRERGTRQHAAREEHAPAVPAFAGRARLDRRAQRAAQAPALKWRGGVVGAMLGRA